MPELMEKLRSVFAQKPGARTWNKVVSTLNRAMKREPQMLQEVGLDYCRDHLLRWSTRTRTAPPRNWLGPWLKGDPRLAGPMSLCHLNTSKAPDAAQHVAKRASYYRIMRFEDLDLSRRIHPEYPTTDMTLTSAIEDVFAAVDHVCGAMESLRSDNLCHFIPPELHRGGPSAVVAVYLNGQLMRYVLLVPDFVMKMGDETLTVTPQRPSIKHLDGDANYRWWHLCGERHITKAAKHGSTTLGTYHSDHPRGIVSNLWEEQGLDDLSLVSVVTDAASLKAEIPRLTDFNTLQTPIKATTLAELYH